MERAWDPAATRRAILDAAMALFTSKGFAAVSVQQIATRAKVAKSLVIHHFGSKRELFRSAQDEQFRPYFDAQAQLLATFAERSGRETMRASMRAYFDFCRSHPEAVRMMLWNATELEPTEPRLGAELVQQGIKTIEKSQEAGELRSDIPARMILMMFFAVTQHWFWTKAQHIDTGAIGSGADEDDAYIAAVERIFLDGLTHPHSERQEVR